MLLQWVDTFKYLGVIVSSQTSNFLPLNLLPVLQEVRLKLKAWKSLPLSLLGRINLIKMKIIPKLTYLFRHSPQWLPKSFFAKLNHIFIISLGSQAAHIQTKHLNEQGGMVFLDCYKYFLAAQLVTVAWLLNPNRFNSSTTLEATVVGSLEALKFLSYRGPQAP